MVFVLLGLFSQQSHSAFPNDFSDVTWIDPNISSWAQTSTITANVRGSILNITDTKASVWPQRYHSELQNSCCNRSLWIIIKFEGKWYASTFEYMRFGQVGKNAEAVNGGQIKRAPFLQSGRLWEPANGEVYGFMTSGMARFNLNNNNVRERSNIALYRWGVGPTDNVNFTEVPRGADGRPLKEGEKEPEPEPVPVECVEPKLPTPRNNSHVYNGIASGTLTVSGVIDSTADYSEPITVTVKDDRTVSLSINNEVYNDTVNPDGGFDGLYDLDVLGRCTVVVSVNGQVVGTNASGTLTGTSACLGATATLDARFNASSQTAPDYIDQRAVVKPRSVCGGGSANSLVPIYSILLEEE